MKRNLKRKLGQNTAEYLIMLVLISVGSIGVFSVFGSTVKHHISNAVAAMTGSTTNYENIDPDAEDGAAATAKARYKAGTSMAGINGTDISFGAEESEVSTE